MSIEVLNVEGVSADDVTILEISDFSVSLDADYLNAHVSREDGVASQSPPTVELIDPIGGDKEFALVVGSVITGTGGTNGIFMYRLLKVDIPPEGLYDIRVTWPVEENGCQISCMSFSGVKQIESDTNATVAGLNVNSLSLNISTDEDNSWVLDAITSGSGGTFIPNNGQTEEYYLLGGSQSVSRGTKNIASPGSNTQGWTCSGSMNRGVLIAMTIEQATFPEDWTSSDVIEISSKPTYIDANLTDFTFLIDEQQVSI